MVESEREEEFSADFDKVTADQPMSRILLDLAIVDTIDTNHICIMLSREGRPRSQIIHTPLLGCIRETLTSFVDILAELIPIGAVSARLTFLGWQFAILTIQGQTISKLSPKCGGIVDVLYSQKPNFNL